MSLVPQVETAELSDADLDQVSGGHVGIDAGAGLYAEAGPVAACAGLGASLTLGGATPYDQARTTCV
ncbi:hypothetical protein ACIRFH_07735 [Streptomyces sp. NPDC093586]|uniref:hypothetical protein n=1 Tax=Streptomyces sp. NPDC093586 TaxID=3366042 RepID=UPI0037F199B7